MMPVNLDPIQTGNVLRLALEGKSRHVNADSNPAVLLNGFGSITEDIQAQRNNARFSSSIATGTKKDSNPHASVDSNPTTLHNGFSSLTEDIQGRRRKIRFSSSVAAETRFPALPPRPSIHHVPKPSLRHCGTSWLPKTIDRLLKIKKTNFSVPKFRFTICDDSATFNYNLLRDEGFKLEKLLNPVKTCCTSYGSELKHPDLLEYLWGKHPRWKTLNKKLLYRCDYPVKNLE